MTEGGRTRPVPAAPREAGDARPGADLAAVLARCYGSTLGPAPWQTILAELAPFVGAHTAVAIGVDRIFPSLSRTESVGLDDALAASFRDRNLNEDFVWQAVLSMPAGSVYRATELIPLDVLHCGPLWETIACPAGLEYALGAILENTPGYFSVVVFFRSAEDFTDADKACLATLLPHLENTLRISRRIELGDAGRREALLAFDRARQPMVVLDRSGYAIYTNEPARRILGQADGLSIKFGRFVFQNVSIQGEFERVLRLALQCLGKDIAPATHVVRVPRRGPGSPYALSVIPLTSSADRASLPDGAGCMVLVYDLERPNPLPIDRLALLYRLTPAEARVCEAIFRLGSVDGTANDLCLTRNTVRSHLKSIYAKFGVVSQGQLMMRLANSLRFIDGSARQNVS